jgi:transposase
VSNHAYINAESVCALLRAVAAAGLRGPITLVLDNTRYQKCALVQALAATLGIEQLYLPSYAPNLNLIERLQEQRKEPAFTALEKTASAAVRVGAWARQSLTE